jgi:uncharacterized C2H2 Zn-finger protein
MTVICPHCNKEYSSQSSRSNHIKKYHIHQSPAKPALPSTKNPPKTPDKNIKCTNCNITFTRLDSLSRHINKKRCKGENDTKENIEILKMKEEMTEYKKEMEKMKDLLQKSLKIHPKTLQKINNQLNNQGTINNITIYQLGKENLSELFTKQEKLGILNRQAMSINDIVELAHTSGKYKSCMNVYITNLQNTIGYMYDEKQNNFIAVNKNELLNDLLDSRMYDIEKFYEEFEEKLEPSRAEKIKMFIERMNDEEDCLKGLKKEEIKLILYNNKEAIGTILPGTILPVTITPGTIPVHKNIEIDSESSESEDDDLPNDSEDELPDEKPNQKPVKNIVV